MDELDDTALKSVLASAQEEMENRKERRILEAIDSRRRSALETGRIVLIACPVCRGSGDGWNGCASDNMDMFDPGGCEECGGSGEMYAATPVACEEDWEIPGVYSAGL